MGRREKHLRELADSLGVKLRLLRGGGAISSWAAADMAVVRGWNPRDQRAYFTGLHELGHVALGHSRNLRAYHLNPVDAEAAAWRWAFDNALEAPGPAFHKWNREEAFGTYVRNLGLGTADAEARAMASWYGLVE